MENYIKCPCGVCVKSKYYSRHKWNTKHNEYLESIEENFNIESDDTYYYYDNKKYFKFNLNNLKLGRKVFPKIEMIRIIVEKEVKQGGSFLS